MKEYIFKIDGALYNEETGEAVMHPEYEGELTRCKDCQWWNMFPDTSSNPELHECKNSGFSHLHTRAEEFCSRAERRKQ